MRKYEHPRFGSHSLTQGAPWEERLASGSSHRADALPGLTAALSARRGRGRRTPRDAVRSDAINLRDSTGDILRWTWPCENRSVSAPCSVLRRQPLAGRRPLCEPYCDEHSLPSGATSVGCGPHLESCCMTR